MSPKSVFVLCGKHCSPYGTEHCTVVLAQIELVYFEARNKNPKAFFAQHPAWKNAQIWRNRKKERQLSRVQGPASVLVQQRPQSRFVCLGFREFM